MKHVQMRMTTCVGVAIIIIGIVRVMMMMMSKEEIVAQAVSEVKLLLTQYNQSTVSFITAWTPSALSRLANNKTKIYEDIPIAAELDFFKPHVKMINELQNRLSEFLKCDCQDIFIQSCVLRFYRTRCDSGAHVSCIF